MVQNSYNSIAIREKLSTWFAIFSFFQCKFAAQKWSRENYFDELVLLVDTTKSLGCFDGNLNIIHAELELFFSS